MGTADVCFLLLVPAINAALICAHLICSPACVTQPRAQPTPLPLLSRPRGPRPHCLLLLCWRAQHRGEPAARGGNVPADTPAAARECEGEGRQAQAEHRQACAALAPSSQKPMKCTVHLPCSPERTLPAGCSTWRAARRRAATRCAGTGGAVAHAAARPGTGSWTGCGGRDEKPLPTRSTHTRLPPSPPQ